jgi:hypothetical protein
VRKLWSELSDNYRQRLERGGITAETHARGKSLAKARGHKSRPYERAQSLNRQIERYAREYAERYDYSASRNFVPPDADAIIYRLKILRPDEARKFMAEQRRAERLYDQGHTKTATKIWQRQLRTHRWMQESAFYYHGVFA